MPGSQPHRSEKHYGETGEEQAFLILKTSQKSGGRGWPPLSFLEQI